MQAHLNDLGALDQRLESIVESLYSQDPAIKSEPLQLHLSIPKYICGQFAWTMTSPTNLASHSRHNHVSRVFTCPVKGCKKYYYSQLALENHQYNKHTLEELALSLEGDIANNNAFLSQCPYPGCGLVCPDLHTLFEHYDGLHPLSIYQPEKAKPYKCSFCAKRYVKERYIQAHQNSSHRPNRWVPAVNNNPGPDQQTLFRESHEAMVEKASQEASETSEPDVKADQSSRQSEDLQDAEKEYIKFFQDEEEEEEYSIKISNDRIYINDDLVLRSPEPKYLGPIDAGSSPSFKALALRCERMAIGYLLQPQSADRIMADADDDDVYPEAFALDEDELPRGTYHPSSSNVSNQFANSEQGLRIFRWVLCLLHLNQCISVSELKDLWTTLLTSDHRILILQQLRDININEDETKILSILRGIALSELINAWAQFKLFPPQAFPEAFPYASLAKEKIYEVLKYCSTLEAIINEGRKTAIDQGYSVPDLV